MNKDTIHYIQQYSSDSDFLFKSSLVNKDFYSLNRRTKIIGSINKKRLLQVFYENEHENIYPEVDETDENTINTSNFD